VRPAPPDDLEWLGLVLPFHEHYKAAMDTGRAMPEVIVWHRALYGYDKILKFRGHVVYKIDPVLEARGLRGADAYLRDQTGHPIPETIPRIDKKAIKFLLQKYRPEKYGDHWKNDAPPQRESLLVIHLPLERLKSENRATGAQGRTFPKKKNSTVSLPFGNSGNLTREDGMVMRGTTSAQNAGDQL
jgi:hypothetical protein